MKFNTAMILLWGCVLAFAFRLIWMARTSDIQYQNRQKLACQYEKFCNPDTTPTWFDEAQDCFCVGKKP